MSMAKVAALYLARHANGTTAFAGFAAAYRRHAAGVDHQLYIACKGFDGPAESVAIAYVRRQAALLKARIIMLPDVGFDLGSYRRACGSIAEDTVCFMNSHARPRADRWLALLTAPVVEDAKSIVGATGSLEIHPHIRTNAFAIRRALYTDLMREDPADKGVCWFVEHGPNNLTRTVIGRGGRALVAGADGSYWALDDKLRDSCTYRWGEQKNLLVSDNQTDVFANGTADWRAYLQRLAWGIVEGHQR